MINLDKNIMAYFDSSFVLGEKNQFTGPTLSPPIKSITLEEHVEQCYSNGSDEGLHLDDE
jgi:hypothetical protein